MFIYRVIIFILFSGVGVYGVIGVGWSSNSKYALLGAYRSVAQIISYDVSIIFIIIIFFYLNKNYNLNSFYLISSITRLLVFGFWFLFLIWFVVILAELNRAPFDFSEGESELVSGFNVEYGRGKFALIFLAEYGNIIFISYLTVLLFLCKFLSLYLVLILFCVI